MDINTDVTTRGRSRGFYLEITSLEDLLLFVAIIRGTGDDGDGEKLQALVTRLRTATTSLADTVTANTIPGL